MKKNRSKQRGGEASDTVASSSPSGTMVKEEPQEHEDIHDDALDGDFLDREVEQHGANNRSEATDRLVSDTVGNVLELGLQLRLSRDEEAETKAKLENVIQLHDESRQKMKEIAEKEISAASMANAQMVKMILQAKKRYKVLKYLISENKSIRESNVDLKEQLKRANAELAKLSGEKVAADNKVQELSAAVTTLEQHGIGLKNQLRLLSYEKAQVEGALNLACDLKVVEENQSENLKKMSELDSLMTVSAARKYELEMRLARARAFLNDTPGVKQEPSNLPKDEGGWQGARCCWAAVKHSRCMSRSRSRTRSRSPPTLRDYARPPTPIQNPCPPDHNQVPGDEDFPHESDETRSDFDLGCVLHWPQGFHSDDGSISGDTNAPSTSSGWTPSTSPTSSDRFQC